MKRSQSYSIQRWRRNRGFTLVELLIVIGIIALLVTISVAVFANFLSLSRDQATAATINKIDKILQQRKDAFDRMDMTPAASKLNRTAFGGDQQPLAEIIVRKQRFKQAFPQRVQDRALFNGTDYTTLLNGQPYESSALLYLAITQGETFGAPAIDEDAFSTSETQTISNGTVSVTYFVDSWGQPLRFYRWPTSLFRTNAATPATTLPGAQLLISALPQAVNRDPDDPLDRLSLWTSLPWFRDNFHLESTFHTPLIVSAGADRRLGMNEPNDASSPPISCSAQVGGSIDPLIDNITNHNQRLKGN
jgi:prepilin-type N-terminal cleavage/methylation domain-containing protein